MPGLRTAVAPALDLKLPVLDGYRACARKVDARTKHIPVIILTTTDEPYEIKRCYEPGVACISPNWWNESLRRPCASSACFCPS